MMFDGVSTAQTSNRTAVPVGFREGPRKMRLSVAHTDGPKNAPYVLKGKSPSQNRVPGVISRGVRGTVSCRRARKLVNP